MRGEPICCENFLVRTDARRHILESDPHQQRVLGYMKDTVAVPGKDDDMVPGLLHELAAAALLADRLFAQVVLLSLQAVRRRQRAHPHGEDDVDTHRPGSFLGRMLQAPLLFALLDTAMLDETALVIVIERLQGLLHRGIGQKYGFAPGAKVSPMLLADHHGVDGVGLEVPAVVVAPMLWRPILVISGQGGGPDDFALQSFTPGRFALTVGHGVHPTARSDPFPGSGLSLGVPGHRHVVFGRHHKEDPLLLGPPQIYSIPKALIKDHLVQAGVAGQVRAGLHYQDSQVERLMLLDWYDLSSQRNLGPGVDQDNQLPAVDRHLDIVHLVALVGDLPLAGNLATVLIVLGGIQIGGIDDTGHLSCKHPSLGQGADDPTEQGLQVPQGQLHAVIGQLIRADGPCPARALSLRSAPLADPVPHLLRIEADQAHERLIPEQQSCQCVHALDAKQGLQAVEQDILDERHHVALDRYALDVPQPVDYSELVQEVEEVIQQRAFVQMVDPVDDLLAVQAPCHPRVIAASDLPAQALGQILRHRFLWLIHRPPPSMDWCFPYSGEGARDQASCLYPNFSYCFKKNLVKLWLFKNEKAYIHVL
jgi:hypothetical protein